MSAENSRPRTGNLSAPSVEPIASRAEARYFVYGAMSFFVLTFLCLIATVLILVALSRDPSVVEPGSRTADILTFYGGLFLPPILLIAVAFACAGVGILLMRSVGAAYKRVIPPEDMPILKELMIADPEQGRQYYIQLSSLSGWTGIFTKMNITGLPLATILLTLVFAILSLPIWYGPEGATQNVFPDLAKLTLGAFLGSYVQRQAAGGGPSLPGAPQQ